jgi:hypothetical protein
MLCVTTHESNDTPKTQITSKNNEFIINLVYPTP